MASELDVDAALRLADEAFQIYRETTGEARAAFLERIGDEIMAIGDALIARAHVETGLPEARLTGERARTVNQLRLFAQVAREGSWVDARIDTAIADRQPVPKPRSAAHARADRTGRGLRLEQLSASRFPWPAATRRPRSPRAIPSS